jgi:hypothetical protein
VQQRLAQPAQMQLHVFRVQLAHAAGRQRQVRMERA